MEGFAAVLTDGRPLPASSERLNERGAVIAQLPTLLPEERHRQRRREDGVGSGEWGGSQREQEVDGEPATDDVLKWEKMSGERSRPREREERTCVMEERRSALGAAHLTPLSQKALQRGSLHYVKEGGAGGTVKHTKASLRSL